jgi:phage baseplate assembly protein W
MNPIGLTLPLKSGINGYFEQSYDTLTQIKANITNFLNTRPGERRFNPQFGTKLYQYLFDQNIEGFDEILKNVIVEDMTYWFPNVIVNTVFLDITTAQKNKNTDNYIINIKIQFTVNNQTDVLGLTVTSNL